jgi:hypothetical protein
MLFSQHTELGATPEVSIVDCHTVTQHYRAQCSALHVVLKQHALHVEQAWSWAKH